MELAWPNLATHFQLINSVKLSFLDFNPDVTWVIKRYMPLDERTYAPVPRHKYMVKRTGATPPAHWIPPRPDGDPEVAKFSRIRGERQSFK